MEQTTRQRIDMLRFLLIAGLVFLHYGAFPGSDLSPFRGFRVTGHPVATFVNAYVLFFFLSAVPLLSMISGYLFFGGWDRSSFAFFGRRISARTRSILLPMVAWNAITLGLFLALLTCGSQESLGILRYDVANLDFTATINALVGVTRHPINFHFWFLRDLFLTVLVSPLLGLALRHAPAMCAIVLVGLWFADFTLGIFFRTDILFFFYLGGLARVANWDIGFNVPRLALASMALYLLLVGLRTLGPWYVPEDSGLGVALFDYGTRLMRLLGVVAVWSASSFLLKTGIGRWMASLGPAAFFLYAMHWPLNQFIKLGLAAMAPSQGDSTMVANYLNTSLLTIAVTLALAYILDASAPRLFHFLSGGRSRILGARRAAGRPATE
ncbi:MAG: acyltransferase family protein [Parvibaculum sp.]|uniref:acyltransferase family protein n=1 Tax=Parvibaculum sp. TaxID=2024848 RepID=UPI002AB80E15|nr:acyltransferase family protein [Parvibaculum sp.]MDZ4380820.1 acyltransferase family protein [Parvibaculum sp.]